MTRKIFSSSLGEGLFLLTMIWIFISLVVISFLPLILWHIWYVVPFTFSGSILLLFVIADPICDFYITRSRT